MLAALCVLVSLTHSHATQGGTQATRWAVLDFLRPSGNTSDYGKEAAEALSSALGEMTVHRVVDLEDVRHSASTLGFAPPRIGLLAVISIGEAVGAGVVVRGEVTECGTERINGGLRGWATLKAIAYDVPSTCPCNGALESAETPIRSRESTDGALVSEAIRLAAKSLVRRMQRTITPRATVLNFEGGVPLINQGSQGGFNKGDGIVVMRGAKTLGLAKIGATEPDQAEVVPQKISETIAPGDRVWAVFDLPLERSHVRRTSSRVLDIDHGTHRSS